MRIVKMIAISALIAIVLGIGKAAIVHHINFNTGAGAKITQWLDAHPDEIDGSTKVYPVYDFDKNEYIVVISYKLKTHDARTVLMFDKSELHYLINKDIHQSAALHILDFYAKLMVNVKYDTKYDEDLKKLSTKWWNAYKHIRRLTND